MRHKAQGIKYKKSVLSMIVLTILCVFMVIVRFGFAATWAPVVPGMEWKQLQTTIDEAAVEISVLKIDPKQLSLRPIYLGKNLLAPQLAQQAGSLAVINANFFDTEGKVLGLVKINGKTINPLRKISWWSVLCVSKTNVSIVHTSAYKDDQCLSAVQAGPRLLVDGKIPAIKNDVSRKTAVGLDEKNSAFFIVTRQALPAIDFAKLIGSPETDGGLGIKNAINLDGGSSSQMYIKGLPDQANVASFIAVPVGLGVYVK